MSTDLQQYDNPYDPNVQDFQAKTLPLDEVIKLGMRALELRLNVWRPAKIVTVKGNGRVDVEIQLQARYINKPTPFTLPVIQDALVSHPRGADYFIKCPIAVGDTGIALFCDRSLDTWSVQGGTVYPNDPRTHSLSDCVFIPGVYPFSDQVADSTTDLVISNGGDSGSQIRLQKSGKIQLKNNQNELVELIDELLTNQIALIDTLASKAFTLTLLGPQPFIASTVALLQQQKTTANQILTKLKTLEGP